MRTLTLIRLPLPDAKGTLGVLAKETGYPWLTTVERSWKNNETDISCVPAKIYVCKREYSPKHKMVVFKLQDVENRTDIEIHIACTMNDLTGCIGLGKNFGVINGLPAVMFSKIAFDEFMAYMSENEFLLRIV